MFNPLTVKCDKPKNEKAKCYTWPSRRTERTCVLAEMIGLPSLAHLPFQLLASVMIIFLN